MCRTRARCGSSVAHSASASRSAIWSMNGMPTGSGMVGAAVAGVGGLEGDALAALAGLGFRRVEAHPVVGRVVERLGQGARLDTVIRDSLKELAR